MQHPPAPVSQYDDASCPDSPDAAQPADVDEQALRWFVALRERSANPFARRRTQADFRAWLASDPSHVRAYDACLRDWSRLAPLESAYRGDGSASQPAAQRAPRWRLAAAALGVAAVAAGAAIWHGYGYGDFSLTGSRHFATTLEQQRGIALRDGSRIDMDVGTDLEIDYSREQRRITLREGAAYFDVAPDAGRPFHVDTPAGSVRVLGTAFEVQHLDDGLRVVVEHGRVRLTAMDGTALELTAGQGAGIQSGQIGAPRSYSARHVAAWRGNRLLFEGEPLADVASALTRRGVWTVQVDSAVAALPVTLTVRLDDVGNALSALPDVLPLQVTQAGRVIRIGPRAEPVAAKPPQMIRSR